jgi:predicted enzyme related to lactoylglutathione lyase
MDATGAADQDAATAPCPIEFVEFPTKDLPATIAFYRQTFGWDYEEQQPGYGHLKQGGQCARVGCGSEPFMFAPAHLAYITVEDIEGKLQEVAAAGGTVMRGRTRVSDEHGYYGLFTDPNGVLWGLWSRE